MNRLFNCSPQNGAPLMLFSFFFFLLFFLADRDDESVGEDLSVRK